MKRVVDKIGVYLVDGTFKYYCGAVYEMRQNRWVAIAAKRKPRKDLSKGDYFPRFFAESKEEAAAHIATLAKNENEINATTIEFGDVKSNKKKLASEFKFK